MNLKKIQLETVEILKDKCQNCAVVVKQTLYQTWKRSKYWHLPLFAPEKKHTKKHVKMPEISLKRP